VSPTTHHTSWQLWYMGGPGSLTTHHTLLATVEHRRYWGTDHTSLFTGNCGTWAILAHRPHITLYGNCGTWGGTGSLMTHHTLLTTVVHGRYWVTTTHHTLRQLWYMGDTGSPTTHHTLTATVVHGRYWVTDHTHITLNGNCSGTWTIVKPFTQPHQCLRLPRRVLEPAASDPCCGQSSKGLHTCKC